MSHVSRDTVRRAAVSVIAPIVATSAMIAALVLAGCMPAPVLPPAPSAAADTGHALSAKSNVKPYDSVVTRGAITRRGMFITHRVGDTLLFEIPRRELGRDMLLVGRLARAAAVDVNNPFGSYGGDEFGERTVRWERSGNHIVLRSPSFAITADTALPVYRAVQSANYAPVIALFDIAAFGPDSAPVIDVTRLYTTNVPELSAFAQTGGQVDERRSYVESAAAFPDNVEIEATQTGTNGGGATAGPREQAQSVLAHWSMVRLPEHLMRTRLADERIGFMATTRIDYGTVQSRAAERNFITRWRLEKRFPDSALSDPVAPIVYYIDPATPDVWKPWIRRAVLDWQPAFEAAGFRNAIVARDPPTDDPDWSPDDVRHTVIRWLPSTTENAVGPHVSDPRTGEILNGSIRVYHNVLNLQRDWYFTQVGPLDPRAAHWPMPDSLIGRTLEYVVAHEIGHTLGLLHNFKASSTYPTDSLRSRTWLDRMGFSPSIMDYSRFDYVAQPEDRIPPRDLVSRVGPYDRFAIAWGYRQIATVSPDSEKPVLDRMLRAQDTVPWLRFGHLAETRLDDPDPGDEAEAVGDADAVRATTLGMRNLARVMPMLLPATQKVGEDNSDLEEIYTHLVDQWTIEMGHVANVVGGETAQLKSGSQPGPVFTPVSRARQADAVRFLNDNAFTTPTFLLDPAVTRRIEPSGSLPRVNQAQAHVLRMLFSDDRLARMIELSAAHPADAYTAATLIADVQNGIWRELRAPRVATDAYRRALQRAYLDLVDAKINPRTESYGVTVVTLGRARPRPSAGPAGIADAHAAMRASLTALRGQIERAIPRAADAATRAGLVDASAEIKRILDPRGE